MSYRSDLVIYMPLERLNGFKDKFPYQCKIVFLKEPGRESVLLKFDYLPGSTVDDMINTITPALIFFSLLTSFILSLLFYNKVYTTPN